MAASVDGVLCDAREATVPLYDDGLLRGDGAFEYLRCYAGRPFTLVEHLDRLARTCATLRLPYERELLESEIAALLAWAGPVFTDLRIVLTRGGRRIVFLEPYLDWPPARLAFVTDSPRLVLGRRQEPVLRRQHGGQALGRGARLRRGAAHDAGRARHGGAAGGLLLGHPAGRPRARRRSATASWTPSRAASS